jgi:hypothetical protein
VLPVLVLVLLLAFPASALAHVRSTTGYSEIRAEGSVVRYELNLEYELLVKAVGLGQAALDAAGDGPRAEWLQRGAGPIGGYLLPRVRLFLDGVECPATVTSIAAGVRQEVPQAVTVLEYDCGGDPGGRFDLRYGVFGDHDGLVDDHVNIVDYDIGGDRGRVVMDSGHDEAQLGDGRPFASALQFVALGVEHILGGLDHVLFVAALLIGARSLRQVLAVASTFTVAHSITLGLAAIGGIDIPGSVVEPLIALSIAYVAADNVVGTGASGRIPVVFGFGLLHGLGFAGSLSFTDDVGWQLITSLLTFNIGIELGQALIVLAVFPLLLLVRRYRWSIAAHTAATAAIGSVGLFWFGERLFLA